MKKYTYILMLGSALMLLPGCNKVSQAEYDTVKNELDAVKSQYASVQSELETVKSQYDSVTAERDQLKSQVDELQRKVEELSKEITDLNSKQEPVEDETVSEAEPQNSSASTDNGDYTAKGKEIGDQAAEALGSIDWDEKKSDARQKGADVANFLNKLMGD